MALYPVLRTTIESIITRHLADVTWLKTQRPWEKKLIELSPDERAALSLALRPMELNGYPDPWVFVRLPGIWILPFRRRNRIAEILIFRCEAKATDPPWGFIKHTLTLEDLKYALPRTWYNDKYVC